MAIHPHSIHPSDSHFSRRACALIACLLAFMALFFGATLCVAQNDIVRLLPPDAPVIAGLHRMTADQNKDALWLATPNNIDDLKRLIALTDSDLDRRFDYVVVADWSSDTDDLGSHLLIAKGHFSMASVLSTIAHPKMLSYGGLSILAVRAPSGSTQPARWLAVPRSNIALFGTPAGVQFAIDRLNHRAPVDPRVLDRLGNAHDREQAWSSTMPPQHAIREDANFHAGSPNLAPCLSRMREIDMGIHVGKTVTIDLHAESRDGSASAAMACMNAAIFKRYSPAIAISLDNQSRPSMRLTLSRADYERWLDDFRKSHNNQTLEAFISGGESNSASNLADRPMLK